MGDLQSLRVSHDKAVEDLAGVIFADECRRAAESTYAVLDQAGTYASSAFPSPEVSARLGWDYPDRTAQLELNGARVRISAALEEIASMPSGTNDLVPDLAQRHISEALIAGWDLALKIYEKAAAAPSATDRVLAGAGELGGGAGDLFSRPLLEFLNRMVGNLWFYLALAAAVLFVVYVKPLRLGVA